MTAEIRPSPSMRSLSRALEVLLMFAKEPEFGIRDLARQLDLDPAVVHRIVTTLGSYGFIERARGSQRYTLGPALRELAAASQRNQSFSEIALRYLSRLRDRTGETVALHSLRDGLRHCTLIVESPHHLRIVLPVGESTPVTAGATDLAFRAFATVDQLQAINQQVSRAVPRRSPELKALAGTDLDGIRAQGWAVSYGVRMAGACAVAAPVVTDNDLFVMTVFGPRERVLQTGIEAIVPHLLAATGEMAGALGTFPSRRP